jgi:DNA-binding response OmpR family regulator
MRRISGMEKKRILLVDDDTSILEVFRVIFEDEGYVVDTTETGMEAIRKVEAQFYHLALLDIKLPDMEGTELLSRLRRSPASVNMMCIMITGYPSLDNAAESLNIGADAYVMKPINPEELLKIVKKKLDEQDEMENVTEQKVAWWIHTRGQPAELEINDRRRLG